MCLNPSLHRKAERTGPPARAIRSRLPQAAAIGLNAPHIFIGTNWPLAAWVRMELIDTIRSHIDPTVLGIGLLVAGVTFLITGLIFGLLFRRRNEQAVAESQDDA